MTECNTLPNLFTNEYNNNKSYTFLDIRGF